MSDNDLNRRTFIKSALISSTALGSALGTTIASGAAKQPAAAKATKAKPIPAYVFLTPSEASFIEALVDHLVPQDHLSPSGSDIGINIYIDRALASSWGMGDRMYLGGPWKRGTPEQGYQLPLSPSQLFRAGTASLDTYIQEHYNAAFSLLDTKQKEDLLQKLSQSKIQLSNGISSIAYFELLYQMTNEGLFADPIYGGNANKSGWKLLGFPGVIATHTQNIVRFHNKPFPHQALSIEDVS